MHCCNLMMLSLVDEARIRKYCGDVDLGGDKCDQGDDGDQ